VFIILAARERKGAAGEGPEATRAEAGARHLRLTRPSGTAAVTSGWYIETAILTIEIIHI
jgi:hypothetical protein